MHLCHPSMEIELQRGAGRSNDRGFLASLDEPSTPGRGRSTSRTCLPADSAGQNLPLLGDALRDVAAKLAEIAKKNRFSQVRHGACSSYSGKTPAVGVPGDEPGHRKE